MSLLAVAVLAGGTYLLRLTGPLLRHRKRPPARLQRLLTVSGSVLLVAVVVTEAVTEGHGFAGWARPAGVAVGVAAARRLPLPLVVLAAAVTTAALRWCGVP